MSKVVELAKKDIGYTENPPGSNICKYNDWFYNKGPGKGPGKPWCGTSVSYWFFQAGFPLGTIDYKKGFAGTNYAVDNVHKWGVKIPKGQEQCDDICFFDFDGNRRFDHTGIFVRKIDDFTFESIEGNTGMGNDSNGGEVMLRIRKYSQAIFVRPNVLNPIV